MKRSLPGPPSKQVAEPEEDAGPTLFAPALGAQRCLTLRAHHPNLCPRGREAAARTPAACLPRHSPRRSPELLCSTRGPFIIASLSTAQSNLASKPFSNTEACLIM